MRKRGGNDCFNPGWLEAREDPVLETPADRGVDPDLDSILEMFPRPSGDAAFDPGLIADGVKKLRTHPEVNTGHPFLDLSVKTGLVFIDATFQGDHPKYGVKGYGEDEHDTFPPTIIAAVDALSAWGLNERAAQLFRYWIVNFVRDDGRINYYGPSISEYGQILHTAILLNERAGTEGWWEDSFGRLDAMVEYLLQLRRGAQENDGLLTGSPEADERNKTGKYFHNNAWAARGLKEWADQCSGMGTSPSTPADTTHRIAEELARDTLKAIEDTWPADASDWWLPPQKESLERPESLTGSRVASYTNYRYWPELLSSGILPADMANRIVEARLSAGGQFCGVTRFDNWLDDWPIADYLYGLWALGRRRDFLLSLYGHAAYHQAEDHLTAYEQVTLPPGREKAPYCLPCQLVAARAARLLVGRGFVGGS